MSMQCLVRLARLCRARTPLAIAFVVSMAACGSPAATAPTDAPPDITATTPAVGEVAHVISRKPGDRLRPPPAGTLRYTIVLTGDLHTTGARAGEKRDVAIRRKIDVTSHMQGVLVNGDLGEANRDRPKGDKPALPPSKVMDEMVRQGEACNDDPDCIMRISMRMMADPKAQEEVRNAGNQALGMVGRTVVWSQRAPCSGHATIDDRDDHATWWEDVGEGYHKSGLNQRNSISHADAPFDCKPKLLSDDPAIARQLIADGTLLYLDQQTGNYDITLAPALINAAVAVNGRSGKSKRAGTPKIALTGFTGAAIGQPISGSTTLGVEQEDGVPLRAEINWTFTPDGS